MKTNMLIFLSLLFFSGYSQNVREIIIDVYADDSQNCIFYDSNIEKHKQLICTKDTVLYVFDTSIDNNWVIINFSYWQHGMSRSEDVYKLYYVPCGLEVPQKWLGSSPFGFEKVGEDFCLILMNEQRLNIKLLEEEVLSVCTHSSNSRLIEPSSILNCKTLESVSTRQILKSTKPSTPTGQSSSDFKDNIENFSSFSKIEKPDPDSPEVSESMKGLYLPDVLKNKVFFRVKESDSGLYVFKGYISGFSGYRFEDGKMKSFGSETFVVDIDSVQENNNKFRLFTSRNYINVFDEVSLDTFAYDLVFLLDKKGFITINHQSLFVDSLFLSAHQLPILEEEPYDIEEVWRNDPANQ